MFSCEFRDIFKNSFFIEHVWWLLLKNPWHSRFIWKIDFSPTCLLSQTMLLFHLSYWNPAMWRDIAIFHKLPLCQLQTVHLMDSIKIGERHADSNTFLCSLVHNKKLSFRKWLVYRRGVLGNFAKLTGKHLCQSLFFNKITGLQLY